MEWDSDDQLLRRWREGEVAAGSTLFGRHSGMLRGFFRRRRRDAADDLVQQTVLAYLERVDYSPTNTNFGSHLFGLARNQLRAYRRLAKRSEYLTSPEQRGFDDVAAPPLSSATTLSTREALLAGAMERLPTELRAILELYYWRGLAQHEIATSLRVPPGTVASRIRRAKEKLRRILQTSDESDESAPDSH